MKKSIFPILLGAFMLVFVSCTNSEQITNNTPTGMLTANTSLTHDWGDINIRGGNVSKIFTLRNSGEGPVTFKTASTSCMCTTAEITLSDGSHSPQFGMHGSEMWDRKIQPGENATIKVTFDPMAHGPNATGTISRNVYVITDAVPDKRLVVANPQMKGTSIVTLNLTGNVLSEEAYMAAMLSDNP